jgi:transcription antitermination factor NusA-like protein
VKLLSIGNGKKIKIVCKKIAKKQKTPRNNREFLKNMQEMRLRSVIFLL